MGNTFVLIHYRKALLQSLYQTLQQGCIVFQKNNFDYRNAVATQYA